MAGGGNALGDAIPSGLTIDTELEDVRNSYADAVAGAALRVREVRSEEHNKCHEKAILSHPGHLSRQDATSSAGCITGSPRPMMPK